jgi:acetyl-CoA carboxylase alpha subunit
MQESSEQREVRLRRLALQLVCLLPEGYNEASRVLRYAEEIALLVLVPSDTTGARCAENVTPLFCRNS